ncbi:exocyst complex component 3-like protein isoform X2 [Anas platyrhynchos]|uniref:exocyst complex component 3-like protein isoform X2 n=1 Tax=Anas platyrhynchos TaxID=8839 RepID=UPI003AF215D4
MGTSAEDEQGASPREEEWPEVEKAEKLARGAALKWASGVFYRPENLEGLGHYRSRETQRNSSIQSRLKDLQQMRALMAEHVQLASVVQVLPQLFSVHEVFSHTLQLLHGQHLLEAHAEIMMLEHLRDDILSQLHLRGLSSAQATVLAYFGGLQELNESLAKQLWGIVASSLQLVREDPVLFVTAVRIIEREEKIDDTLLLDATFLPPGRPKGWRQKFYHVLQETITGSRFHTPRVDAEGPGLSRHLEALQRDIVSELRVVKDLMVQCVPAHYNILSLCAATYHQALAGHLQDLLREDLDKQALFHLLKWVLHVYHSSEMMGHPDLLPEVDVSSLGPLISPELVDQTERRYVVKLKASVLEWMQRTLKTEFEEWFWEKEPETDHQGFFQSDLPVHVIEMLNSNIEVTSSITDSLQQKVYNMALEELEAFLGRLREALVQRGKEHQQDRTIPKHYVHYLLAMLNNVLALSSSVPTLHPNSSCREVPASLRAALDRTQKKACQLLLEELLLDLQPLCVELASRKWLSGAQLVNTMCEVIDKYAKDFSRVKKPLFKLLLMECELLVANQYLRALMQKKMVCKSKEERRQFCDRLLQDATQLRELFCSLGLDRSQQNLEAVFAVRELLCLKDTALLSLEVLGFVTKYPDVSDEHISTLLDLRGDVSKEVRHLVLEMMAQHPQALPESYQPIFSTILVPAPELPFCLRKGKCA